jgi:putative tricarboxylic transport membrane protein
MLANLLMLPFGYLSIKFSSNMLKVPKKILMPAILMFCIVGSFAINNSLFDVGVMLAMGIIGYIMEANDIPVAPVVLGLVLGPIIEQNFMVSMIKTQWNILPFFSRPISAVLGGMTVLLWFSPMLISLLKKRMTTETRSTADV